MKNIEALETVFIGPGTVLKLSKAQALARGHMLVSKGEDVYQTTQHMQFKRGEKFGFEGVIPKSMREVIAIDGKPAAPVIEAKPSGPLKMVMPKTGDIPIMRAHAHAHRGKKK